MLNKYYRTMFWFGYISVALAAFIPVGGNFNRVSVGPESFHISLDHLLHSIVYFIICLYFLAGFTKGLYLFSSRQVFKFFIFIFSLAIVTELVQLWIPYRSFNLLDLAANLSGIFTGALVIGLVTKKSKI